MTSTTTTKSTVRSGKGRRRVFALAAGSVAVAALAATGAGAANASTRGFSSVESCTGVTGSISYSPGLRATTLRTQQSVLTGTLSGCSGFNGAQAGTGTITIVASGSSSVASIHETGTVTVNWPASAGLNPSNGTVTLTRTSKTLPMTVSGSFTSGAFTGAAISTSLLETHHAGSGTTAHPIIRQDFVNTTPFAAKVNLG
jgi:hypothetical protein